MAKDATPAILLVMSGRSEAKTKHFAAKSFEVVRTLRVTTLFRRHIRLLVRVITRPHQRARLDVLESELQGFFFQ